MMTFIGTSSWAVCVSHLIDGDVGAVWGGGHVATTGHGVAHALHLHLALHDALLVQLLLSGPEEEF